MTPCGLQERGTTVYNGPVVRKNHPDVKPGVSGPVYRVELHMGSQTRTGVVTEETKKKFLDHAGELSELSVRIKYRDVVPWQYTLHFWNIQPGIDAIAVAELLNLLHPGIECKLDLFLPKLAVPDLAILGLRFG